jgi:cell division septation protein DedD
MEQAAVRNLEQIQEQDDTTAMPRALSLGLVALGVACVAFAVVAVGGRKTGTAEKRPDPLGDLVAQHAKTVAPNAPTAAAMVTQLSARDVTFPSILSDDARPTTALAAVRSPAPTPTNAPANVTAPGVATAPPPAADRLPVVTFAGGTPPVPHDDRDTAAPVAPPAPAKSSLPAQNILEASPIVTRPRDPMTKTASEAGDVNTPSAAQAPSGHEGSWQLQVSSFKTQSEAEQFADQLRARGHKAYTVEARVVGRGTWWRVRVGPFPSQHAAQAYRATFEAKEHVVPFVVQPEKTDKH